MQPEVSLVGGFALLILASTPMCVFFLLIQKHFPEEAYTFLSGLYFNGELTSGTLGIWHSLVLYSA